MRGRRPNLKVVAGSTRTALPFATPPTPDRKGMPCPRVLTGRAAQLWERYSLPCTWLTAPFDEPKAIRCVRLLAESERGSLMAARETILRSLLTDLGLDPANRVRLAGRNTQEPKSDAEKYFFDD